MPHNTDGEGSLSPAIGFDLRDVEPDYDGTRHQPCRRCLSINPIYGVPTPGWYRDEPAPCFRCEGTGKDPGGPNIWDWTSPRMPDADGHRGAGYDVPRDPDGRPYALAPDHRLGVRVPYPQTRRGHAAGIAKQQRHIAKMLAAQPTAEPLPAPPPADTPPTPPATDLTATLATLTALLANHLTPPAAAPASPDVLSALRQIVEVLSNFDSDDPYRSVGQAKNLVRTLIKDLEK